MNGPSPHTLHPIPSQTRLVYLKNVVKNPHIIVGDYTYYDDPDGAENFERNVLYHFDFIGDRLIIGKFCAIAAGVRFVMNGGNHRTDWITNYPFPVFGSGWEVAIPDRWPDKGDTIVGNDVWIGYNCTIMPGVNIGDGAIVAANSVVTRSVDPYTVMGGNPGKKIRNRFSEEVIRELLEIRWWDWDIEKISRHVKIICSGNIEELKKARSTDIL